MIAAPGRTLDHAPTVFAGTATDSTGWISAEGATGRVVVLYAPPAGAVRQLNGAVASRRWRGATAIALTILDAVGSEAIARLREGRPIVDTTRNPNVVPILWISRRAATAILGADPATLTSGAEGMALTGHFDVARRPTSYPARNAVAILRGSDPALNHEYVALTAHNDHVGSDHSPVDHDSLRAFNRVVRPMGADSPNRQPTPEEWTRIRTILDRDADMVCGAGHRAAARSCRKAPARRIGGVDAHIIPKTADGTRHISIPARGASRSRCSVRCVTGASGRKRRIRRRAADRHVICPRHIHSS